MDTQLRIEQIEIGIAKFFNLRQNLIVCNVSWGLLNHEADMVIMSKAGYITEIEIKRSLSDLKADFKKKHDHSDQLISQFYYAVPVSISCQCINLIDENKRKAGCLAYSEDGRVGVVTNAPIWYDTRRRLFLEEKFQLARLGNMRSWSLKEKVFGDKLFD